MNKTLYIGNMPDCKWPIFAKVKFEDGKFTISAVEGPMKSGNCKGSAGQCRESLLTCLPEGDLSKEQLEKLYAIWNEWHLNDLQAGSPDQEKFLEQQSNDYDYNTACTVLEAAGLNPDPNYMHNDEPYRYGSAWLRKEVPEDVIEWVFNLPSTSRSPNWV